MADEPVRQKTCILRASIHCEGCKRKVKKILSQVQGVEFVDVDTKQHKVTVIGNVDADTLIKKLTKSRKNAELWPQKSDKIPANGNKREKEKEIETHGKVDRTEAAPPASDNGKTFEVSAKLETATKSSQATADDQGGSAKPNHQTSGGDAKPLTGPSPRTTADDVHEKKSDEKIEESCSAAGEPSQAAEKNKEAVEKSNGGGGGNVGEIGKKKKKKGQSRNPGASGHGGSENQEAGPPAEANQSPPRNYQSPFMPPPPQPVYGVSYNTAYPTSSYTASYYAAPPPYAYAHMHPAGREIEPPPLDHHELNPRQPLDSFEIFSDENPNGCFIM
ncbi:hypothetical protein C2S51_010919 [Perilla frutescens var. frutescens]|nr:hypothetical protein C2S51_010919 [Perilla frutescens var. frutescens]